MMSRIRGKDTAPERIVRSIVFRLGYRYRLHGPRLPGRPDLVLTRLKTVILVHGCFWHRHKGCRNCTTPTGNRDFWVRKFAQNVERDRRVLRELRLGGWRVIMVWECETEKPERLARKLEMLLATCERQQAAPRKPRDG